MLTRLDEIISCRGFAGIPDAISVEYDKDVDVFVSKWGGVMSQAETHTEAVAAIISAMIMKLRAQNDILKRNEKENL